MDVTEELSIMLAELESSCLEVILVPTKRYVNVGGCIRVAANKNTQWYREFCARYTSGRGRKRKKHDTRIRRDDTIAVLNRLIAGKKSCSKYAPELRRIARDRARNPF
jgi:hypothetical protein